MAGEVTPSASARLYWAAWKAISWLPPSLGRRLAGLLRIKIPTTPAALAASIMFLAGSAIEGFRKIPIYAEAPPVSGPMEGKALGEVICAHYLLGITILGQDEFAGDAGPGSIWNLYTALTYQELKKLMQELKKIIKDDKPAILSDRLMDETTQLYMHDKPTLLGLAARMPDFCYRSEVEKVAAMNDWFCSFVLKAQIRTAAILGVRKENIAIYIPLGFHVKVELLEAAKFFKKMRPVFVER